MAGQPWMKWFPGDWLKAPDVRSLSPAARGLWFDMLCLMHSSSRRGYLLVGDSAPSLEQLARMTGCDTAVLTPILTELRSSGVYDCTEHGVIYCRRMVREAGKAEKCSEAGKRGGGNPALKQETFIGLPKGVPKGSSKGTSDSDFDFSETGSERNQSKDIEEVFAHYKTYHPRAHKNPQAAVKEWNLVKARLKEGYSVQDLKDAIDGCHRSPFHMGENEGNVKYDSLELICRNSSKVSTFIELSAGPGPVMNQKTLRTMRAANDWLAERMEGSVDAL